MSRTKKISLSVKKNNEECIDILDAYADRHKVSRSDFVFRLVNQYHYHQLKEFRKNA